MAETVLIGTGKVVALYGRTPQYNERDRTPLDEQLAACRQLASTLGYTVTDETVVTEDGANTSLGRAGVTRLIGLIAQKRVAAVIIYTLDRLGRPENSVVETLLKELRRREVPLYVAKLAKGYSYDPVTGKLLNDPVAVAEATREDVPPPSFIVLPREDEPHDLTTDLRDLAATLSQVNGTGQGD